MLKAKYSIITALAFSVMMFTYLAITSTMDIALVVSIFFLLVSPLLLYFKMFSKMEFTGDFTKVDKNIVKRSGRASHFKNGITVGGTLYLLGEKIIFQTNIISFLYRHEEVIDLDQIVNIDLVKTMGLVNNGLRLQLKDNSIHQFVVSGRETWKTEIEKYLNNSQHDH